MATYQGKIRETCEIRKARLTNDKNKAEIDYNYYICNTVQ